jgi:lipoyl(octanoyl) transferase
MENIEQVLQEKKEINVVDLGMIDYDEALNIQEKLLQLRQENCIDDILLILEHEPVITIGKRGNQNNILAPKEFLAEQGVKICSIGRGGDVTYHGPGQIVGYPIMRFQDLVPGVRELVHSLEEIFIQLLQNHFQMEAKRDPEHPGVWVGNDKITAIGLLIRLGVTMHGFAFNVNTDLSAFHWILSCGIMGKGVTSIKKLTGQEQDISLVKAQVVQYFGRVFHLKPHWKDREELNKQLGLLS